MLVFLKEGETREEPRLLPIATYSGGATTDPAALLRKAKLAGWSKPYFSDSATAA